MSTKILAIIFTVLLVAVLAIRWGDRRSTDTSQRTAAYAAMFEAWDRDGVHRLVIVGPDQSRVELIKSADTWVVDGATQHRADLTKVAAALEGLAELKMGRVMAQGGDLSDFGLSGSHAIRVSAQDAAGKPVAELIVGKSTDHRHTFLEKSGAGEARKVEGDLRRLFAPSGGGVQAWRDKTIWSGRTEADVQALTIRGPAGQIDLDRISAASESEGAAVWRLTKPLEGEAVSWQCEAMARTFCELTCERFHDGPETPAELGLDPPTWRLSATVRGQTSPLELHVGVKKDRHYAACIAGQPGIWWVPAFRIDTFTKPAADFLSADPSD